MVPLGGTRISDPENMEKKEEEISKELSDAQDEHMRHPNIDNYRRIVQIEKEEKEDSSDREDQRLVNLLLEFVSKKKKFDEAFVNLFDYMKDNVNELND